MFRCSVLGFLVVVAVACSRESGAGGGGPGRGVPVNAEAVRSKPAPVEIVTFGTVEPSSSVALKAQVTGVLNTVHFAKGDDVKKGQLLFSVDPRPYQVAVAQADGALARDKAQAAQATRSAARDSELVKSGLTTQADYEKSQSTAESLAATLLSDQGALDNARLQLSFCTIRSPIDGRAGEVLVRAGNLVTTNQSVLVTINQIRPIEVGFSVPQGELLEIQKRMGEGKLEVRVLLPGAVEPESGELNYVDNTVDKTTGTIRLTALFDNAKSRLWPGLYVNVRLILGTEKDALVVPTSSVQAGRDGKYVYAIRADRSVESRTVTVRAILGDETVISDGLRAGEMVVTDGQVRLVPGAKVEVQSKEKGGPPKEKR
jgi:membrane fusion protein, multidrug efflux system